jgi:predicted LPLAT superfamily acyltransferase
MSESLPLHRRLLHGWLEIAARFGEVQTLVLLAIVYLFVIGPSAAVARLAGRDFLAKRKLREPGSAWQDADTTVGDVERSKHPF